MRAKRRRNKRTTSHTKRDIKQRRTKNHSRTEKKSLSTVSNGKAKQKDIKGVPREPITRRRLWLFRIVALIIIPALFFLLLEAGLRIVGYGYPPDTIIKCKLQGEDACCDNIKFGWRFFPRNIARVFEPFVFSANKPDETYRVFVLGASAAQGTPEGAFCFGRILQVMLQQQYPQTNFEVITVAMPAINSHVVLEIAKDCGRHQPDLFVVYLGNNEVVGPYGVGTVFTPLSSNLSLIRFGISLKATKLGQLVTNLLQSAGAGDAPDVWGGLKMFLEKQVRADDIPLEVVYRHFQRNLQDIRRLACKSGTKIIFCTVPSNLKDNPPFASLGRLNSTDTEKENWDELYQRGLTYETDSNHTEAVEQYLEAAEIDDRYADLQFRLGRCYWAAGEYEKARDRYIRARELDTLRFRADTRINEIIRDTAGDKAADGVYLVDAVKLFERNSPHKTAGEELFYEHVHMNFKGNYLLADTIFRQAEEILPERIKRYRTDERPLSTETECSRYLAYTDWDSFKIAYKVLNDYIKRAPFTNQLYHNQRVRQMEQNLMALKDYLSPEVLNEVQAQYRWAIQQRPSDWWLHWKYGELLEALENYNDAAEQYRFVLNLVPHHYRAYARLGFLSGKRGNLDAAISQNLKALQIYPVYDDAHFNLGLAYYFQNRLDESVEHYYKAIRFKPDYAKAYNNLAIVLYQQGKVDKAIQTYRDGLIVVPDDFSLHYNLGIALKEQGHRDEAIKELRAALQIDPNSIEIRKTLESILKNTTD